MMHVRVCMRKRMAPSFQVMMPQRERDSSVEVEYTRWRFAKGNARKSKRLAAERVLLPAFT